MIIILFVQEINYFNKNLRDVKRLDGKRKGKDINLTLVETSRNEEDEIKKSNPGKK